MPIPRKEMEQGLNKNKIKTVCFPHTQREDRESERKSPDSLTSLFRLPLSLGQYSIVSARAKIRWPQCSARPEQAIVLSESETPGENKTGTNTQCKRGVVQRSCTVSIHGHAGLYLQQLCVCVRACVYEWVYVRVQLWFPVFAVDRSFSPLLPDLDSPSLLPTFPFCVLLFRFLPQHLLSLHALPPSLAHTLHFSQTNWIERFLSDGCSICRCILLYLRKRQLKNNQQRSRVIRPVLWSIFCRSQRHAQSRTSVCSLSPPHLWVYIFISLSFYFPLSLSRDLRVQKLRISCSAGLWSVSPTEGSL